MIQPDQVTSEVQTLMRNGLLPQQNLRRWAGYRVPGNSPQLAKDSRHLRGNSPQYSPQLLPDSRHLAGNSRHLSPELPSLRESARRIRYSRIANPSFD
jgi:hypothetical protein